MSNPSKSTPEQIRARFDADVERFSNLDTGQASSIDAPPMPPTFWTLGAVQAITP